MATRKSAPKSKIVRNRLAGQMKVQTSMTLTENGQLAYGDTGSALLNLFAVGGSMQTRTNEVAGMFRDAYAEDKLSALKMAFYFRDIRGKSSGQGERDFIKEVLKWMARNDPKVLKKNLKLVPFYGRWDDLYALVGTPLEADAFILMKRQLDEDIKNFNKEEPISLLAKWLKSVNTSSEESNKLGRLTAKRFGMSVPDYRKTLSPLRTELKIVEKLMSANKWEEIDFASVPSKAHTNYRKAFGRHEEERYSKYLSRVEKGEAVIKSTTLYPHNIFDAMGFHMSYSGGSFRKYDKTLQLQWNALPDYVRDGSPILVMADTSGSMESNGVMSTSVSLATYFAERNSGIWKNMFLVFSEEPKLVTLTGNTLEEKVACIKGLDIANTDLRKAFELVLSAAVSANISAEEMPKALVVISDMEIDQGCRGSLTFHREMVAKFARHGYELPYVVYWNVASRHDVFHATSEYESVMLASGRSASTFASILANLGYSPMEAMMNVLNDERYSFVTL